MGSGTASYFPEAVGLALCSHEYPPGHKPKPKECPFAFMCGHLYNAAMPNPVIFFEIGCKDTESTSAFYSSLFDWKMDLGPSGALIDAGAGIPGQINSLGHEPHQYTIFYVQVDDVQASVDKAVELGGALIVGPIPIPIGTFAWISDPGGNTIGLWKPNS